MSIQPNVNSLRRTILKSPHLARMLRDDLINNKTAFLNTEEPVSDVFNQIIESVEGKVSDKVIEHLDDTIGLLTELGYIQETQFARENELARESM